MSFAACAPTVEGGGCVSTHADKRAERPAGHSVNMRARALLKRQRHIKAQRKRRGGNGGGGGGSERARSRRPTAFCISMTESAGARSRQMNSSFKFMDTAMLVQNRRRRQAATMCGGRRQRRAAAAAGGGSGDGGGWVVSRVCWRSLLTFRCARAPLAPRLSSFRRYHGNAAGSTTMMTTLSAATTTSMKIANVGDESTRAHHRYAATATARARAFAARSRRSRARVCVCAEGASARLKR